MKKKTLNAIKAAGLVLSLSLAVVGTGVTSYAASDSVSDSDKLDGTPISYRLSKDSTSATATTTYSRRGDITAKVMVYYKMATSYYYSTKTVSATSGGATAVAKKVLGGADVEGAKGTYKVIAKPYTWGPVTLKLGTVYSESDAMLL